MKRAAVPSSSSAVTKESKRARTNESIESLSSSGAVTGVAAEEKRVEKAPYLSEEDKAALQEAVKQWKTVLGQWRQARSAVDDDQHGADATALTASINAQVGALGEFLTRLGKVYGGLIKSGASLKELFTSLPGSAKLLGEISTHDALLAHPVVAKAFVGCAGVFLPSPGPNAPTRTAEEEREWDRAGAFAIKVLFQRALRIRFGASETGTRVGSVRPQEGEGGREYGQDEGIQSALLARGASEQSAESWMKTEQWARDALGVSVDWSSSVEPVHCAPGSKAVSGAYLKETAATLRQLRARGGLAVLAALSRSGADIGPLTARAQDGELAAVRYAAAVSVRAGAMVAGMEQELTNEEEGTDVICGTWIGLVEELLTTWSGNSSGAGVLDATFVSELIDHAPHTMKKLSPQALIALAQVAPNRFGKAAVEALRFGVVPGWMEIVMRLVPSIAEKIGSELLGSWVASGYHPGLLALARTVGSGWRDGGRKTSSINTALEWKRRLKGGEKDLWARMWLDEELEKHAAAMSFRSSGSLKNGAVALVWTALWRPKAAMAFVESQAKEGTLVHRVDGWLKSAVESMGGRVDDGPLTAASLAPLMISCPLGLLPGTRIVLLLLMEKSERDPDAVTNGLFDLSSKRSSDDEGPEQGEEEEVFCNACTTWPDVLGQAVKWPPSAPS